MATDLAAGTPLAQSLQNLVQPKLAEFGWTTGGDDTTLFDYILLMLSNGKNEEQVATELSNDLLDEAEGENTDTHRFARWLFEQVDQLRANAAGGLAQVADNQMEDAIHDPSAAAHDMEMEGITEGADPSSGIMYGIQSLSAAPTFPCVDGQRDGACGLPIPIVKSSRPESPGTCRASHPFIHISIRT